jgi:hypothetical protein
VNGCRNAVPRLDMSCLTQLRSEEKEVNTESESSLQVTWPLRNWPTLVIVSLSAGVVVFLCGRLLITLQSRDILLRSFARR